MLIVKIKKISHKICTFTSRYIILDFCERIKLEIQFKVDNYEKNITIHFDRLVCCRWSFWTRQKIKFIYL